MRVVTRVGRKRELRSSSTRGSRALRVKKHFYIVVRAPRGSPTLVAYARIASLRAGRLAFLRGFLRRLVRPMVNLSTGT